MIGRNRGYRLHVRVAGDKGFLTVKGLTVGASRSEFVRPEWLGAEVTGDARYYNSRLAEKPFREWDDK